MMRIQKGLTLIEVLVTLVITSIGLLGVVALQATGLQEARTSLQRTIALNEARAIIDAMKANQEGVASDAYDSLSGLPASTINCRLNNCTAADLAIFDHTQWANRISAQLTNGSAFVCEGLTGFSPTGPTSCGVDQNNVFSVVIYWDEDKDNSGDMSCNGNPGTMQCLLYTATFN